MARNEHLAVIMLDPFPKNEEFEIWPRHITIVPWFPCDDEAQLDETLRKVADKHQQFNVKAGKLEQWGKKEKYDVQIINDSGKLHQLHWDIFHSLEKNGFPIHQKDFLREKFKPHIALRNRLQRGEPYPLGKDIEITSFTLVKQIRLKKSGRMIKALVRDYQLK
ncbi:hypothetical protein A3E49_02845 [Candidatus Saccharibacteria bacterium RIFCSPHIGHO2_12_FULL_49_19]|nr:MAG: hypothetical protein A2708_01485 [Candidatus Saccharibacteria bacterium RIFCSPHIGHO2_01_FULL_49_21]OGL37268.1 MAG: hypothetical protein A3E49_02845 [Candidatus Saccharibacteria bacterium RIFCSPHIGHO2_12_FULL_49_19]OGL37734.1 MAG: hypothetical protein A3B63_00065 [Candidatus Saccharibacteria bacterium RIFCSPLOWO2_01_FULL_49_22]